MRYPLGDNVKYANADKVVIKTNKEGITINLTFFFFVKKKDETVIIDMDAINWFEDPNNLHKDS